VRVYQFRHIRAMVERRYRTGRPSGRQASCGGRVVTRFASLEPCCSYWPPSSRGLGRRPLTAVTRVRIPLAVLVKALQIAGFLLARRPPRARICASGATPTMSRRWGAARRRGPAWLGGGARLRLARRGLVCSSGAGGRRGALAFDWPAAVAARSSGAGEGARGRRAARELGRSTARPGRSGFRVGAVAARAAGRRVALGGDSRPAPQIEAGGRVQGSRTLPRTAGLHHGAAGIKPPTYRL
jgi:hypothetical protein